MLGLGIVLLGGIWWWGARRSRQAPGNAQMREFTAPVVTTSPPDVFSADDNVEAEESGDWGVPPFEPLSIRTADFDDVPHIDLSMTAHSEPFDDTLDLSNSERLPVAAPAASVSPPFTQDAKMSAGTTPVSAALVSTVAAHPTIGTATTGRGARACRGGGARR